jgi:hypothetical protein
MGTTRRTGESNWGVQLGLEQNSCGRGGDLFETADSGFLCAAAAARTDASLL